MKRVAAVLLLLATAACETEVISPTLDAAGELQIRPELVRSFVGSASTLKLAAFDSAGKAVFPGTVQWLSLDPATVTVNSEGAISALAPGWARIVATGAFHADTATVAVAPSYVAIAGGEESACGWDADGVAYCWGGGSRAADEGILGSGAVPVDLATAPVTGGLRFSTMAVGRQAACGIANGSVWCWGNWRGDNLWMSTCRVRDIGCHTPERVQTTGTFTHIDIGGNSAGEYGCASGTAGLVCWGRPPGGSFPQPLKMISGTATGPVAVGSAHACSLTGSTAYCWGDNRRGALGTSIPPTACSNAQCMFTNTLLPVANATQFTDLKAGAHFTCGLATDGRVLCWGDYDRFASISPTTPRLPGSAPVSVSETLRFGSISAGPGHACGVATNGGLYCWGDASWTGALGDPMQTLDDIVAEPRRVMAPLTFTRAAAMAYATCGISVESGVLCIGRQYGLGNGSYQHVTTAPIAPLPPGPLPSWRPAFPEF